MAGDLEVMKFGALSVNEAPINNKHKVDWDRESHKIGNKAGRTAHKQQV